MGKMSSPKYFVQESQDLPSLETRRQTEVSANLFSSTMYIYLMTYFPVADILHEATHIGIVHVCPSVSQPSKAVLQKLLDGFS